MYEIGSTVRDCVFDLRGKIICRNRDSVRGGYEYIVKAENEGIIFCHESDLALVAQPSSNLEGEPANDNTNLPHV